MKIFNTIDSKQTQKLGEILAQEIKNGPASTRERRLPASPNRGESTRGGGIICLEGELGSGKTTFTQGLLKGLGVKGPYTSPTFLVIKNYQKEFPISKSQFPNKSQNPKSKIQNIYHIDAYRVNVKDMLNLGWEEIAADKNNVIIIEWADKIRRIIPKNSVRIKFKLTGESGRKITVLST